LEDHQLFAQTAAGSIRLDGQVGHAQELTGHTHRVGIIELKDATSNPEQTVALERTQTPSIESPPRLILAAPWRVRGAMNAREKLAPELSLLSAPKWAQDNSPILGHAALRADTCRARSSHSQFLPRRWSRCDSSREGCKPKRRGIESISAVRLEAR
jgi:hypothetical protein